MARPHTCFVQAQMIPWSPGLYGGARNDVTHKVLSSDDADGSSSCIVRYPAGWGRSGTEVLNAHEEFLVLDGSLEINGRPYERHSYGFLPAGYARRAARSTQGAILLDLFYGEPRLRTSGLANSFDPELLVEYVNPLAMARGNAGNPDPLPKSATAFVPTGIKGNNCKLSMTCRSQIVGILAGEIRLMRSCHCKSSATNVSTRAHDSRETPSCSACARTAGFGFGLLMQQRQSCVS